MLIAVLRDMLCQWGTLSLRMHMGTLSLTIYMDALSPG